MASLTNKILIGTGIVAGSLAVGSFYNAGQSEKYINQAKGIEIVDSLANPNKEKIYQLQQEINALYKSYQPHKEQITKLKNKANEHSKKSGNYLLGLGAIAIIFGGALIICENKTHTKLKKMLDDLNKTFKQNQKKY